MSHLTSEQFVDLMDATLAEADVPHLSQCAACQEQVSELRAALALAADAEVPEPSPWFWDQLSARVREAIAAEPQGIMSWVPWPWRAAGFAAAVALAALVVALVRTPGQDPVMISGVAVPAAEGVMAATPAADDESFAFVADLAGDLDWESVSASGFGPPRGVEQVVAGMTNTERAELRRLLDEALGSESRTAGSRL